MNKKIIIKLGLALVFSISLLMSVKTIQAQAKVEAKIKKEKERIKPTLRPTPIPQPTPIPRPTLILTPTPTPTPEKGGEVKLGPPGYTNNPDGSPSCGDTAPEGVSEIWVESEIVNDNCVDVHWSPPTGADKAHIWYSEVDGEWRYALLETPNDGIEEIRCLKNGVRYYFQVAGVNGCAVGSWSNSYSSKP